jgi:2-phosphosulfolactate phosphatase
VAATVIACGERWPEPGEDGALRVAIEDYLGAGAILSYLAVDKSPEAQVCEGAFRGAQGRLTELLHDSISGRELRQKGWDADVEHAAQLNVYDVVPVMWHERLESFQP